MNYTEKYHLPQWVKDDRIMMDDFNEMCANIESGISDAKTTAATARSEAAEAAKLPYVIGSYTGDGTLHRDFELGFRPRFIFICGDQTTLSGTSCGQNILMAGPNITSRRLFMTDTGFRFNLEGDIGLPRINHLYEKYDYIAFR